jgi:ankyrin repeat protein
MNSDRAAELLALALAGDEASVRALLPSAGSLSEDDVPSIPGGMTALMGAAAGGCEAVVALLLQCGADPSRRDTQGHSAAGYARAAGHPHLAELLDTVVDLEKTMR